MGVLKYLALICVIALAGWLKLRFYCRKPYNECSSEEKRVRLAGAAICGVRAIIAFLSVLRSL